MNIADCIAPENVEIGLAAPSKMRLLQILSEKAGSATSVDHRAIFAALRQREALGSTGVGAGIALPHAPVRGIGREFGFIARLATPVPFDAVDETPVDIICLLLSPEQGRQRSLPLLSRLARLLRSEDRLARIRAAASSNALYREIVAAEA